MIGPIECAQQVSLLYAIVFGADGACISISVMSILTAFAAFMGVVVLLQFLARRAWARLMQSQIPAETTEQAPTLQTNEDIHAPYESPIKKSRF